MNVAKQRITLGSKIGTVIAGVLLTLAVYNFDPVLAFCALFVLVGGRYADYFAGREDLWDD